MAERKLAGKDKLLFIDPSGGTAYKTVVCLTSNSYERSANTIDATTKCGTDTLNGTKARTVNFEGIVLQDPASTKLSEADLDDFFEDDTVVGWKMAEVAPTVGSVTYAGQGRISNLTATYGMDNATFSATMNVIGVPTKTITSGAPLTFDSIILFDTDATPAPVAGITGTAGAIDAEQKLEFNAITPLTGLPISMTIIIGGVEEAVFDTTNDYVGHTFRYTTKAGVIKIGTFADGDVTL